MFLILVPLVFATAYLYPYLPGHDLPWCAVKIATGIACPGCGMVRAVSALVHGNIAQSVNYHPFGLIVALFLVYLWAREAAEKIRGKKLPALFSDRTRDVISYSFVGFLLLRWVMGLI